MATKRKKIRYKRRIVIYSLLVFVILFSIADYYCETHGLPDVLALKIKQELKQQGFDLSFEVMKCGIINGIVLTNPVLKDSEYSNNITFSAKKMGISFNPSLSANYFLEIDSFEIEKGDFEIPLFPECILEGKADIIKIENFNSKMYLTRNGFDIKYFSGSIKPFKFNAAGSLKNVFSTDEFSMESAISAIKSIPFSTRADFYKKYLLFKGKKSFKGTPELRLVFNIDNFRPETSTIKADMKLPYFEYEGFVLKNIKTRLSYSKKKLIINTIEADLSELGKIYFEGIINPATGLINGNIKGSLSPKELTQILDLFNLKLPLHLQLSKKVLFTMKLKNMSVDSLQSQGVLSLKIPEVTFKRIKIFNLKTDFTFSKNTIYGSKLSFSTKRNKVSGDFQYNLNSESIDASIQFSGPPFFIANIIGDYGETLMNDILKRFTLPKDDKNIETSADIHFSWSKEFFYYVSGHMVMNSFKYLGIPCKSGDARVIMDSNDILIIPVMTIIKDNALATSSLVYDDSRDMKYNVNSDAFKSKYKSNNRLLVDIQSSLNGVDVLKCIFPNWENKTLDMSDQINMKASGTIDFSDKQIEENMTDFKVKIFDSSCKWSSIPVKNLNCDLIFKKLDMEVKNVKAKVHNGDLNVYYKINFITSKGKVNIQLKDADFEPIAKHVKWKLKGDKGKLSVNMDADFEYDKDYNLLMTGNGDVNIRDANLWEIPILKTFGNLTSQWIGENWGVISSLDANYIFKKDNLFSENIQTNGDVVSLRSNGKYYWNNGDFDFLIHAEILRSLSPFKILYRVFDPITSFLERRVVRKEGKTEWQKVFLHEKIFKSKD